ncbi:MAG: hypothetical protein EG828_02765 [Deltaproteobacteria bacterium]|nr:hypothetical protein [Deltaproteobacteria bacterium]
MKNESTPRTAHRVIRFIHFITLLAVILAFSSGCSPSEPSPSPAALSLKTRIQANLDLFIPELSESLLNKKNKKTKTILDIFYSEFNGPGGSSPFSLALLDGHGVTITSRSHNSLSGSQNYGNYQVVSNVLQKKRAYTSSLYLQGGGKVHIICVPLLSGKELAGVIFIGIDSEYMRQTGITESQFMSLDFNSQSNGTL